MKGKRNEARGHTGKVARNKAKRCTTKEARNKARMYARRVIQN